MDQLLPSWGNTVNIIVIVLFTLWRSKKQEAKTEATGTQVMQNTASPIQVEELKKQLTTAQVQIEVLSLAFKTLATKDEMRSAITSATEGLESRLGAVVIERLQGFAKGQARSEATLVKGAKDGGRNDGG